MVVIVSISDNVPKEQELSVSDFVTDGNILFAVGCPCRSVEYRYV